MRQNTNDDFIPAIGIMRGLGLSLMLWMVIGLIAYAAYHW